MNRRIAVLATLGALVLGALPPAASAADSAPMPDSIAAVGDSITQAASSGGTLGADYPANSWSTGTSSTVTSHYLRLLAAGAPISGRNWNESVSGAKVADLDAQMRDVVALQPDYLTVLIGGNDLCTDTVAEMTSVSDFRSRFETAMATLTAGSPDTYVLVVSIPDVYQLWNLFKNDFWARFIWSTADICQSLLANPTSTQQADVERRQQVRQRNIDFNTQLAEVCLAHAARCHWDGNAVFDTAFTKSDVSGDYFHPSIAGQAKLAQVSWNAGFSWSSGTVNQPPTAAFTHACTGLSCTFTNGSTDGDGTVVASSWSFGDGATSTATSPSHTYGAGGTYTVGLTVTDDDGATATTSASVTVTAPAATPMWVTGMSGSATSARNGWTARVTISVADASGALSGVTVSGTWSTGGSATCTTGATGQCTVTSPTLNKKTASTTFSVTGLSRAGWVYAPSSNVETSETVLKP